MSTTERHDAGTVGLLAPRTPRQASEQSNKTKALRIGRVMMSRLGAFLKVSDKKYNQLRGPFGGSSDT